MLLNNEIKLNINLKWTILTSKQTTFTDGTMLIIRLFSRDNALSRRLDQTQASEQLKKGEKIMEVIYYDRF